MRKCSTCGHLNPADCDECQVCGSLLMVIPPRQPRLGSRSQLAAAPEMSGVHTALTVDDIEPVDDTEQQINTLIMEGDNAAVQNNSAQAFAFYERAFVMDQKSTAVLLRMLELAKSVGDPVRESRCLATMSQVVTDPIEQADYLIQAAHVTRAKRHEPEKAAFGLMRAIELNPDRLDAFLTVTEIYSQLGQWEQLEGAYQRMIQLHMTRSDANVKLLAKLWRKLGTLLAQKPHRLEDAEVALNSAIRIDPHDLKNHATRFEIYRQWPGRWMEAVEALQALIEREREPEEQVHNLKMLSDIYIENDEGDAAFCVLRALLCLGQVGEAEGAFVASRIRPTPLIPDLELSTQQWREDIYPSDFPYAVAQLFSLIALAVHPLIVHEVEDHGAAYRDKLDINKPLLFCNLIRNISTTFGLERVPQIFIKDGEVGELGMIDGLLDPPGFIVSRSLLSGRRAQELSYITGRLLAFQKQDLFMIGVCSLEQLRGYVMAAVKFAKPSAPIAKSRDISKLIKAIKSNLSSEQRGQFKQLVLRLIDAGAEIELDHYVNCADDIANRLALLVCDDLDAAAQGIAATQSEDYTRTFEQRFESLLAFSVSPSYVKLRRLLGLAT